MSPRELVNIADHQTVDDVEFREGRLHTGFIDEFFARTPPPEAPDELVMIAALAALLHQKQDEPLTAGSTSGWLAAGRDDLLR